MDSGCCLCGGKNAKMTRGKYYELASTLVFGCTACTDNLPLNSSTIVEDPENETPVIVLPQVPQTLALGTSSTTGRVLNRAKIDKYVGRSTSALEKMITAQNQHLDEAKVIALGEKMPN